MRLCDGPVIVSVKKTQHLYSGDCRWPDVDKKMAIFLDIGFLPHGNAKFRVATDRIFSR
jgi:hypothetical protein